MVKKSDLKSGMLVDIVTPHNHTETYVVILGGVAGDMLVCQDGWIGLNHYDEYLQNDENDYNIVDVYFTNSTALWTWNTKAGMWGKKVKVTKPVEMTLAEIEEKLGYSIKIVEEN